MVRSIYGGYEADKPASELKAPEGMRRPQRLRSKVSLNSLTIDQLCALLNIYQGTTAIDRNKRIAIRLELDKRIEWPSYE